MESITLKNIRLDAAQMIVYQYLIDENVVMPVENVVLMKEEHEGDEYSAHFTLEDNAEVVYSVTYKHPTNEFFVTKYIMVSCAKFNAELIL